MKLPHISRCEVFQNHDTESGRRWLTLTHWHNDKAYTIKEDLPIQFMNMGYHAKKAAMTAIVAKMRKELGSMLEADEKESHSSE